MPTEEGKKGSLPPSAESTNQLVNKLQNFTLEDLPFIPPHRSYENRQSGKIESNTYALPDQKSLDSIKKIVPNINSITTLAFQGIGFVCQQNENGFEGKDLFGYYVSFRDEGFMKTFNRPPLSKASADLEYALKNKLPISLYRSDVQNIAARFRDNRIILLKDLNNPKYVQI